MKKIIFIVIVILSCGILSSCKPSMKKYESHISEIRSNLFEGNINGIKVDAITGFREEPFDIDGKTENRINFTLITIYPNEYSSGEKFTYTLTLDEVNYNGTMIKHPFNNTYSCEIDTYTTSMNFEFALSFREQTHSAILSSIIKENFIGHKKALEIGVKKLAKGIKSFRNNNINYEIYVRLIPNHISSSGGYHWYVAFVGENDTTYAVLIEPVSLDIVAIRN